MVFHQFERLIGQEVNPKTVFMNQTEKQLQALGFSADEAEQLAWLENHQSRGKWFGLAAGLVFLYFTNPFLKGLQKKVPQLLYQPQAVWMIRGSVLLAFS